MSTHKLPPAEILSRWTVNDVLNWLPLVSLTVFREKFLQERIDGNKLMRLQPDEIDKKYSNIPTRKRSALKENLIGWKNENARAPVSDWRYSGPKQSTPVLDHQPPPPRPPRVPPQVPPTQNAEHSDSDNGDWASDFDDEEYLEPDPRAAPEEDSDSDSDSYLEPIDDPRSDVDTPQRTPTHKPDQRPLPPQPHAVPTSKTQLGQSHQPEDVYEVPDEEHGSFERENGQYELDRDYTPPSPKTDASEAFRPYLSFEKSKPFSENKVSPVIDKTVKPPPRPPRQPPVNSSPSGGWLFNNSQGAKPNKENDIETQPWYHGNISREAAEAIVTRKRVEGMYLVRKSERDASQPYTLTLWHNNRKWNLPIRLREDNRYAAGKKKKEESTFGSMEELVTYFTEVSLSLKGESDQSSALLIYPAPKD